MYRACDSATGAVIAEQLRPAHTHWTRLKGLLGTRSLPDGEGLWLKPCRQVHTVGMQYAIDVVFLDAANRVLRTVAGLGPRKISPKVSAAVSTLELPSGTVERTGLREGAQLVIEGEPDAGTPSRVEAAGSLLGNFLLGGFYAFFAQVHLGVAQRTGDWFATGPIVVQEALLAVLFVMRRSARSSSAHPSDWAAGITGTFLPLLLRPTEPGGPLSALGRPLQFAALMLAITSLASLGRSVGIVASNRGVQTRGLYRLVRHPMYTSYAVSYMGYLACFPTWRNGLIVALTLATLATRAVFEERFLVDDPVYQKYAQLVPWRFLPFVY